MSSGHACLLVADAQRDRDGSPQSGVDGDALAQPADKRRHTRRDVDTAAVAKLTRSPLR